MRYPPKREVPLTENALRKVICDINIIDACLNKSDLPGVTVSGYVTPSARSSTYM